jgi:hypothetical protein
LPSALGPHGELEPVEFPIITHTGLDPGLAGGGELQFPGLEISGRVIIMDFFISRLPHNLHGQAASAIERCLAQAIHGYILPGLIQQEFRSLAAFIECFAFEHFQGGSKCNFPAALAVESILIMAGRGRGLGIDGN